MFNYQIDEDLSLKLIDYNDADELYALADRSRNHLRPWLPWIEFTTSVADTKNFIKGCTQRYTENNGLTACILYKGEIAGIIGFHAIDHNNNHSSIGYWLGADYTGLGIMTRACRAMIDYAFNDLDLNRIEIRAADGNKESRAIPERLGFVQEGRIRQASLLYDRYVDHVVYGMLAEEWEENK